MNTIPPVMTGPATPTPGLLAAPVAAYLGRFKGLSRQHTESDLRIFTTWCTTHDLDPLTMHRSDLELYVRLMPEIRPVQAIDRRAPHLGHHRLLPHLHR